jgi:hypothetical protein
MKECKRKNEQTNERTNERTGGGEVPDAADGVVAEDGVVLAGVDDGEELLHSPLLLGEVDLVRLCVRATPTVASRSQSPLPLVININVTRA